MAKKMHPISELDAKMNPEVLARNYYCGFELAVFAP